MSFRRGRFTLNRWRIHLLIAGILQFISSANAHNGSAGYTDSLGNYTWFNEVNDTLFADSSGQVWFKITENKELWDEAMTIRIANVQALIMLGFDSIKVSQDVFMYDEKSSLFTKLSHLTNNSVYVKDWEPSFNSETFQKDAKKSQRIKSSTIKTDLALKFYSRKANVDNVHAIGLNKKGIIKHGFEAGMEVLESIFKKIGGNKNVHSDPIFDMHLRNAKRLLNKTNKKSNNW